MVVGTEASEMCDFKKRERGHMKLNPCPNLNHRTSNASVRCCPNCGKVVNDTIPIKQCSGQLHAQRRMNRSKFCVDCGEQLIK